MRDEIYFQMYLWQVLYILFSFLHNFKCIFGKCFTILRKGCSATVEMRGGDENIYYFGGKCSIILRKGCNSSLDERFQIFKCIFGKCFIILRKGCSAAAEMRGGDERKGWEHFCSFHFNPEYFIIQTKIFHFNWILLLQTKIFHFQTKIFHFNPEYFIFQLNLLQMKIFHFKWKYFIFQTKLFHFNPEYFTSNENISL